MLLVFNRPSVAGTVLETPPPLTDYSVIHFLHKSQAIRARDLRFLHNVHHQSCVTCHMSIVTCHMSCVNCHISTIMCHLSHVMFFLQIGRASRWRVCYQRSLPCLVSVSYPCMLLPPLSPASCNHSFS